MSINGCAAGRGDTSVIISDANYIPFRANFQVISALKRADQEKCEQNRQKLFSKRFFCAIIDSEQFISPRGGSDMFFYGLFRQLISAVKIHITVTQNTYSQYIIESYRDMGSTDGYIYRV